MTAFMTARSPTRLRQRFKAGLVGPKGNEASSPNLWFNPDGSLGNGSPLIVYNDGLSVTGPDRWVSQQVTTTPYVTTLRSQAADGSYAIRMLNGYMASGSNTVGTGTKSFQVAAGLNFAVGFPVKAVVSDILDVSMSGTVASYSGTTVTLNVATFTGSGTFSSWVIGKQGKTTQAYRVLPTTGATAPGDTVLTFADTSTVEIGGAVESRGGFNGIPPAAYVVSKTSTTVTISAPVTSQADSLHPTPGITSGQPITFYGDQGIYVFQDVNTFEGSGFKYGTPEARTSYLSASIQSFGVSGVGSLMMLGYSSAYTLGRSFVQDLPVSPTKTRQVIEIPGDTVGAPNTWVSGYNANSWGGLWGTIGFVWESQGTLTSANIPPGVWSNTFAVAGSANQTLDLTNTVGAWVEVSDVKLEFDCPTGFYPPTSFSYPSPKVVAKSPAIPYFVWEATSNGPDLKNWQSYVLPDGTLNFAKLNDAHTADFAAIRLSPNGAVAFPLYAVPGGILQTDASGNVGSSNTISGLNLVGGTVYSLTGLSVRSTGSVFDLNLQSDEVLTASRGLKFTLGNASRRITLGGDLSTVGNGLLITDGSGTHTASTSAAIAAVVGDKTGSGALVFASGAALVGGTHYSLTGLSVRSTSVAFDLNVQSDEALTASRALKLTLGDADRRLTLAGDLTTTGAVTVSGAGAIPLGAWTTYTPTASASGGTANVYGTLTGRRQVTGKRVDFQTSVPVTTNNGSGVLTVSLPPGLPSNGMEWSAMGFDTGFTGNPIFGRIPPNSTVMQIKLINGAYPAQSGSALNLSGFYETP